MSLLVVFVTRQNDGNNLAASRGKGSWEEWVGRDRERAAPLWDCVRDYEFEVKKRQ